MNEFSALRQKAGLTKQQAAVRCDASIRSIYRWENDKGKVPTLVLKEMKLAASLANRRSSSNEPFFDFIDLFAGIGGLRLGFEPTGGQCVFTSEWDKACNKTYTKNFVCDHEIAGDITEDGLIQRIPPHDVLLAGFPCQPFSIAGVSKKNSLGRAHGFSCDTQGTLFFEVARSIDIHRPKAIVLENVKNLVSHDKGNTFKTILRTLDELDYDVSYRVINAKGWVPQHRQRIFIVGFRRDLGVDFNLDDMQVPDPNEGPKLKTILLSSKKVDDKYTLSEKLWNYLQGYAAKHKAAGNGFGFGLVGANDTARTLSARYYKDGSEILVKQAGTKRPRRLTPRECARLMGFDKPGGKEFEIVVSDTQAYKQFGNAVVVPVVEAIAEYMKPTMLDLILKHGKESARPPKNLLQTDLFEPVAEYA